MVDDQFKTWLIEINSSPAMDYSTDITEKLVKKVLPDTLKVILDYKPSKNKKSKSIDTGLWKCIYKGSIIKNPKRIYTKLQFHVKSKKLINKNKRKKIRARSTSKRR